MFAPLYENSKGHWNRYAHLPHQYDGIWFVLLSLDLLITPPSRTIHGMVYNAMKLFMEINPTLFEECTGIYAADQESAPQRQQEREAIWKMLEDTAAKNKKSREGSGANQDGKRLSSKGSQAARSGSPMQIAEDGAGDSERKMVALNIHDEGKKVVGVA